MAENTIYLKNQEKIIKLAEEEDKLKKSIAQNAKEIAQAGDKATEKQKETLRTQSFN